LAADRGLWIEGRLFRHKGWPSTSTQGRRAQNLVANRELVSYPLGNGFLGSTRCCSLTTEDTSQPGRAATEEAASTGRSRAATCDPSARAVSPSRMTGVVVGHAGVAAPGQRPHRARRPAPRNGGAPWRARAVASTAVWLVARQRFSAVEPLRQAESPVPRTDGGNALPYLIR